MNLERSDGLALQGLVKLVSVDVDSARGIVTEFVQVVSTEKVGIINAFGRTIANDIVSEIDIPPSDIADRAGYAAYSDDTKGATNKNERKLSILSSSPNRFSNLARGTVIPISKGQALPKGADTVISGDSVLLMEDGLQIIVMREFERYEGVIRAGKKINCGDILVHCGVEVSPFEMGLMASVGIMGVDVSRKPRIAIITTGAKTVDLLDEIQIDEKFNSARYEAVGMILKSGCELGRLIHVQDGRIGLERAISDAISNDAVLIAVGAEDTHGMAVSALNNLGNLYFERIQMEPGGASAFAMVEGKPVFVVPADNLLESFEAFVRPGLLKMLRRKILTRKWVRAGLGCTLKLSLGASHYVKAQTNFDGSSWKTDPLRPASPGYKLTTSPNSLIIIPANLGTVKCNEMVDVIMLDD